MASGDHLRLLDQLADSVLVVAPIAGAGPDEDAHARAGNGTADFDIIHLSPGYIDPAGRAPRDIAGRTLLEAYPGCASGDGLAARAARVLADGAPQYAPGPAGPLTGAGPADPVPVMDLRAARYDGGVIFTWRGRVGDEGRLGEAFEHGRTRVALAAARDLLADSEQRAAEQQELALRLQRAMMPADVGLMETCGVDIAVRCGPPRPATWSRATGTTRSSCPTASCCSWSGTSPATGSTRSPAWSPPATRCAGWPRPGRIRMSC